MPRKIYLATSWRNEHYPTMLIALRSKGHEVYDFRTSGVDAKGFTWKDIGLTNPKDPYEFLSKINHQTAYEHYNCDKTALDWCDTLVLLLPCGKDAHLEAGYAAGRDIETYAFMSQHDFDAGLMYKLLTRRTTDVNLLMAWLDKPVTFSTKQVAAKDVKS